MAQFAMLPWFQSAPPVKGATRISHAEFYMEYVSIRAPREGGDALMRSFSAVDTRFNPRPP